MQKIQPAMSEQRTMLQACQASKALQKTFEDDYQSLVDFTAECIQVNPQALVDISVFSGSDSANLIG